MRVSPSIMRPNRILRLSGSQSQPRTSALSWLSRSAVPPSAGRRQKSPCGLLRRNTIQRPSGENRGDRSRLPVPDRYGTARHSPLARSSTRMPTMPCAVSMLPKIRPRPSGVHSKVGGLRGSHWPISRSAPPLAAIISTWQSTPGSTLRNAIERPSGDHAGALSSARPVGRVS